MQPLLDEEVIDRLDVLILAGVGGAYNVSTLNDKE